MRSLVVVENPPWPADGGALVRNAQVVEAMAAVTDLDLFVVHQTQSKIDIPSKLPVARWQGGPYPRTSSHLRWRLEWAVRRGIPVEVAMARADRRLQTVLRDWARPPYDVVWFSTSHSYTWAGQPDFGPTIVDLDNLEDVKSRMRAELLEAQGRTADLPRALVARLAAFQARLNSKDWRQLQRAVAGRVDRVAIASQLDADRSGLPNVAVIPNTYPRPLRPAGNPAAVGPAIVLFQGRLGYPPNIDAAEWLASAIAPRIRAAVPSAEVRLVGRPATSLLQLHHPGVFSVVGQVPSMEEELARATVAVVPIRYGSGTRVKILESFAHRVPVVSTTLGAEGLGAENGVHLLVADDPEEFAASTVRLLGDPSLRLRLTAAAEELYSERYETRAADLAVRRLVEDVARRSTRS